MMGLESSDRGLFRKDVYFDVCIIHALLSKKNNYYFFFVLEGAIRWALCRIQDEIVFNDRVRAPPLPFVPRVLPCCHAYYQVYCRIAIRTDVLPYVRPCCVTAMRTALVPYAPPYCDTYCPNAIRPIFIRPALRT